MCHPDSLLWSPKLPAVLTTTSTRFETNALEPDRPGRDDRYSIAQ